MRLGKVSLEEKFAAFSHEWSPKIAGEFDNYYVKLVRIGGEFVWHHHESEDELFFVVEGAIAMHYREESGAEHVERFGPGEFLVVPRGVEHKPVADPGTKLMLIEQRSVVNTGNVRNERTSEAVRI
ncbi:MAG TPA: cupin domain-containing protein [Candidatus Acidoferrales bacterium]|nr:cupin domain-containing protein [Candidatus Acidoferrales bacterium]